MLLSHSGIGVDGDVEDHALGAFIGFDDLADERVADDVGAR